MSDHIERNPEAGHSPGRNQGTGSAGRSRSEQTDLVALLDECLEAFPDSDPRQRLLLKLRHAVLQGAVHLQEKDVELRKLQAVVEKLTAPANRIGILLDLPGEGLARIAVGGAEYYTTVDPRVSQDDLKIGTQILVNEAYALIKTLGYDRNGPVLRVAEALPDGRIRFEAEPGRQTLILQRSGDLVGVELRAGDEVRVDPTHRIAIERIEDRKATRHLLDEVPSVTWDQIGGQAQAITAIRKAIEYPLIHAETFAKYRFTQPKGFLLYGPPGCGKTMIGQAAAASLSKLAAETHPSADETVPITRGVFLHVKGPEILNMWLGESERIVREIFAQARARRKEGALPFIFIDEAESILGTRRAMRSFNITNTLVPMFCTEMDGIESLRDVVIILASNRPDLIDPAVLRPGRIDRKIKVERPDRTAAADILRVYLTADLPYAESLLARHDHDAQAVREMLVESALHAIFGRVDEHRVLAVRLRNGQTRTLYRSDLLSGAILASIVQRAKERAIDRSMASTDGVAGGLIEEDVSAAVRSEFREGEVLPPDDSAEEWLKLLDHQPDQVVGISSYRRGRPSEERLVNQII
ncbi:MAG: AAA family ATPase [Nitrospiraceae bacterium]